MTYNVPKIYLIWLKKIYLLFYYCNIFIMHLGIKKAYKNVGYIGYVVFKTIIFFVTIQKTQ
jgi:hypothetical protein